MLQFEIRTIERLQMHTPLKAKLITMLMIKEMHKDRSAIIIKMIMGLPNPQNNRHDDGNDQSAYGRKADNRTILNPVTLLRINNLSRRHL